MMWSAHSSTIVGSAPALKCRCDLGVQSEQPCFHAATFKREVINSALQTRSSAPFSRERKRATLMRGSRIVLKS